MRLNGVWRISVIGILLGAVALCLSGCLDANRAVVAAYDAASDQFRFLTILQHIHSSQDGPGPISGGSAAGDYDWLKTLHANRDHLIIPPFYFEIFRMTAFVRFSNSEYATINMGGDGNLTVRQATIPLNDIVIKPGTLFRP